MPGKARPRDESYVTALATLSCFTLGCVFDVVSSLLLKLSIIIIFLGRVLFIYIYRMLHRLYQPQGLLHITGLFHFLTFPLHNTTLKKKKKRSFIKATPESTENPTATSSFTIPCAPTVKLHKHSLPVSAAVNSF